jgi:eukaryotic-like serine/threonine-protein kinase
MNSDLWRRIEAVYDAVLTLPPERREFALEELCAADTELRREVESLLNAREHAGDFLTPGNLVGHIAALIPQPALPAIGSRLGDYEILAAIGAGAMGEVYRARDARLGRDVALKILPAHLGHDPARVARFQMEAKAASALNHPNIVTVYEIGRAEGMWYIASELVEGANLRQRILAGQTGCEEAASIGAQCAAALGAAHRAGIVHRDVKPENIMLRPDGVIKIVDFGLARIEHRVPEDVEVTQTGVVMGTPRYMSPEQARGEKPDARSDIFSLGAVLFELTTGRPAFPGKTMAEVFSALLNQEPDIHDAGTLGGVFAKAMAKDPASRYETMEEFASALLDGAVRPAGAATEKRARKRRTRQSRYATWAAALALVLGAAAVYALHLKTAAPNAAIHASTPVPLTGMDGLELWPSFSPDGNSIVYARDAGDGRSDLYVKPVPGGPPRRLPAAEPGNRDPSWSPDGLQIALLRPYGDHTGVFIMSAEGGVERLIGNLADPGRLERSLAWSPEGKSLVVTDVVRASTAALWLLPLDGSARRRITSPPDNSGDIAPAFSPDGKTLAFIRITGNSTGELFRLTKPDSERRIPTGLNIDSFAWSADGTSILVTTRDLNDRGIWRIRPAGGDPVRISGAGAFPFNIAVAPKGDRLAFAQRVPGTSDILRLDSSRNSAPRKLIASAGFDTDPSISPDGKLIAFASTRTGKSQIWVAANDGSNPSPVTYFDERQAGSPSWSPDGRHLAFDHQLKTGTGVFVVNADGGTPRELVYDAGLPQWSPDGRWIYFRSNRSGSQQIWKIPSAGGAPARVTQNGGFECFPSPDGRLLYFTKARERAGIWRIPVDGGMEEEIPELRSVVTYRYWSGTSAGIYFLDQGSGPESSTLKFYRFADRRVERVLSPAPPPMGFIRGLAASPDGRQVLWVQLSRQISQILLVENFR